VLDGDVVLFEDKLLVKEDDELLLIVEEELIKGGDEFNATS
jgi:hypothetical protein